VSDAEIHSSTPAQPPAPAPAPHALPRATPARTVILGIIANASLAMVKLTAGILGNSYAMIADAVESFSDIASSLITLQAVRVAARPPDAEHPYGHGKAEAIGAMVVSVSPVWPAASRPSARCSPSASPRKSGCSPCLPSSSS
jgi:Co/Zn/Cd efflux system component